MYMCTYTPSYACCQNKVSAFISQGLVEASGNPTMPESNCLKGRFPPPLSAIFAMGGKNTNNNDAPAALTTTATTTTVDCLLFFLYVYFFY